MSRRYYLMTCVFAFTALVAAALYLIPISEATHDLISEHNDHPAAWAASPAAAPRISYGGLLEQATVVVFATLFVSSSAAAFHFIRTGDIRRPRQFIVRTVAENVAVLPLVALLLLPTSARAEANAEQVAGRPTLRPATAAEQAELKRILRELDGLREFTRENVDKVLGIKLSTGSNYPRFRESAARIPEGPFGVVVLSEVLQPGPQSSYRAQIGLGVRMDLEIDVDEARKAFPNARPEGARPQVAPMEPDELVVRTTRGTVTFECWPNGRLTGIKLRRF